MNITDGNTEAQINTLSNWPLVADLFVKQGFDEHDIEAAKADKEIKIFVEDVYKVTSELAAWGIPWKLTKWKCHE